MMLSLILNDIPYICPFGAGRNKMIYYFANVIGYVLKKLRWKNEILLMEDISQRYKKTMFSVGFDIKNISEKLRWVDKLKESYKIKARSIGVTERCLWLMEECGKFLKENDEILYNIGKDIGFRFARIHDRKSRKIRKNLRKVQMVWRTNKIRKRKKY